MNTVTDELIQRAIEYLRSGDKTNGLNCLRQALSQSPKNPRIWYLLSQAVSEPDQSIYCLKKVLEFDPRNRQAIERLEKIQSKSPGRNDNAPDNARQCWNCGKTVSLSAVFCETCGAHLDHDPAHPNRSATRLTPPAGTEEKSSKKKRTLLGNCIGILAIVIVLILSIGIMVNSSINGLLGNSPKPTSGPYKIHAVSMCKEFVIDRLKAPKTAEFAPLQETIVNQVDDEFTVLSYVDSENSFGAMLRTEYSCKVRYLGNDKWQLLDLNIDAP